VVLTVLLGVVLISVLIAIHRTETRRAYWLGFTLFGSAYLGLSLVPPIESRLITTKALALLDSKLPRLNPIANLDFDKDGWMDIVVANNSRPLALAFYRNNGDGTFQDESAAAGLKPASKLYNSFVGAALTGPAGTTENFVRIGHSLFTLVAAFLGGRLSRYVHRRSHDAAGLLSELV
jgi:hypothetical protein